MRSLPDDPFAFQARVMSALCDDILDPTARRDGTLPRMAALREVSKLNRGAGGSNKAPASNSND